ncbi:hypothetical protein TanjilG_13159 [Lupinus angustifolius]|nr:hypothetical protein TanjilG_13159 [Lupinus angustifolius]
MAEEKDVFFVVKKGDVVGIYNSFTDIQPLLASSSVSGDSISIHKGYALPKKSEEYLISHGLKGASYSINASDVHEGLFGRLLTCPYQHPPSTEGRALDVISSSTKLQEAVQNSVAQSSPFPLNLSPVIVDVPRSEPSTSVPKSSLFSTNYPRPLIRNVPRSEPSTCKLAGSTSFSTNSPNPLIMNALRPKPITFKATGSSSFPSNTPGPDTTYYSKPEPSNCLSCTLHFDGASKGNPGPAGAGAVLRAEDDSKVQGKWKIKNQNMGILCNEAKELKNKFLSFQINHVLREFNSEADAQANLAVNLRAKEMDKWSKQCP